MYNAPEIYHSKKGYNRLVDMWSVGVVSYAALSGTLPFAEDDLQRAADFVRNRDSLFPDSHWQHVSDVAKDLIGNKLLVIEPAARMRPNVS